MSEGNLTSLFFAARCPLAAVLRWWPGAGPAEAAAAQLLAVADHDAAAGLTAAHWRELLQAAADWAEGHAEAAAALLTRLLEKQTPAARAVAAVVLGARAQPAEAAAQFQFVADRLEGEAKALALLAGGRLWQQANLPAAAFAAGAEAVRYSTSLRSLTAADKLLRQIERSGEIPARRRCRIGLVGSVTLDLLIPPLRAICRSQGVQAEFWTGGFGQHAQELLDPASGLAMFKPEVVIVACDWRSLHLPEEAGEPTAVAQAKVDAFQSLWQQARERLQAHVIQFNFEVPAHDPYGRLSASLPGGAARVIREINRLLFDAENAQPGLTVADIDQLAGGFGKQRWSDPALWHSAKQYPAPEALPVLARYLAALVRAVLGLTAKCLVLDLDNTLWGGVVGEDGVNNLVLGGEHAGEAFATFQKYALGLKRRGIVLAVCSKNNEADARLPFEKHPDMVLTLADISLFVANWQPKDENLRHIAKTLNIGLDSLVFADDSAAERVWVRQRLPEVEVVDLPADPARYIEALERHLPFEALALSAEDRQRAQAYRENQEREGLRERSGSVEEFRAGLAMTVELQRFDATNLPRVVQLINKTNQFNLTTRRLSESQVTALMSDPKTRTLAMRLKDRFGDYGLTGVLIGVAEGTDLRITVWLMSCRVMGRGAEDAMLAALMRDGRAMGFTRLIGEYIPTAKNSVVRDLYPGFAFSPRAAGANGEVVYEFDLRGPLKPFPQGVQILGSACSADWVSDV